MKQLFFLALISITPFSYSQCEDVELSVITNDPTCYGFCDGSITLNATGTEGEVIFEISNAEGDILNSGGSNTANSLCSGWYYVSIEDETPCIVTDSIFLDQPGPIEIDVTLTECVIGCDGSITVDTVYNYQGDYGSISYYWVPNPSEVEGIGATEQINICGDPFFITINDVNGCSGAFGEYQLDCIAASVNENLEDIYRVNYADKQLFITSPNPSEELILTLFNTAGSLLLSQTVASNQPVTLDELPSGIHIYQIRKEDGTSFTGKFMVE